MPPVPPELDELLVVVLDELLVVLLDELLPVWPPVPVVLCMSPLPPQAEAIAAATAAPTHAVRSWKAVTPISWLRRPAPTRPPRLERTALVIAKRNVQRVRIRRRTAREPTRSVARAGPKVSPRGASTARSAAVQVLIRS